MDGTGARRPTAPRRNRRWIALGLLAATLLAAWYVREIKLFWRLQAAAMDAFVRWPPDSREAEDLARQDASADRLAPPETMVGLAEFSPRQLAYFLSADPSAGRRAIAAAAILRSTAEDPEAWRGVGADLAAAVRDRNGVVRWMAIHALMHAPLPATEIADAALAADRSASPLREEITLALGRRKPLAPAMKSRLHAVALRGTPPQRMAAFKLLRDALSDEEAAGLLVQLAAGASFRDLAGDDPRTTAQLFRLLAPEETRRRFAARGEDGRDLLVALAPELAADRTLAAAAADLALRMLDEDDSAGWEPALRTLALAPDGLPRLAAALAAMPPEKRARLATLRPTYGRGRSPPAILRRSDLAAIAAVLLDGPPQAGDLLARWFINDQREIIDRLGWSDDERARLRAKLASAPFGGPAWYVALQVTTRPASTEEDLVAFETALAKGAPPRKPNEPHPGYGLWGKIQPWYLPRAGLDRALPKLAAALPGCAEENVGFIAETLAANLNRYDAGDAILARARSALDSAYTLRSQLSAAAAIVLERTKRPLEPADERRFFRRWLVELPLEPIPQAPEFPTVARARKLVRDESARAALRQLLQEAFDPPARAGAAAPATTGLDLSAAARGMPEFPGMFAAALRTAAASPAPTVRRRAVTGLDLCEQDPTLATETLERLLHDPDAAVVLAAVQSLNAKRGAWFSPKVRARLRALAGAPEPRILRAPAIYALGEAPDFAPEDRAAIAAAAADRDEAVKAAGRFAERRMAGRGE